MLRTATVNDFAFLHDVARAPDCTPFITDEPDSALQAYLDDPSATLLIWEKGGEPKGYALFCGVGGPSAVVELRRLALSDRSMGHGRAFMRALVDYAFQDLGAARLWLDASSENSRAHRTYERAGFRLEGRQRSHWFRPTLGRCVDLLLFGMLRAEWQALEPVPDPA